jgi:hypothetical protein
MSYTHHAVQRMQQRAIPPMIVDLLERFGSSMRSIGAERLFFDKAACRRLRAHLGGERGLKSFESWLNVYIVIGDDGQLITVARQNGRFRRR